MMSQILSVVIFKSRVFKVFMCQLVMLTSLLGAPFVQAEIPALLMTPEQRQTIDRARQTYLTQPMEKEVEKTSVKKETPGLVVEDKTLLVSAILNHSGDKRVQINGIIYKESEFKQGIQVHRIGNQTITLTANGKWGRAKIGVLYDLNDWPLAPESKIRTKP